MDIKQRLKNLKVLADNGYYGEASAARCAMNKLIKKYGLNEASVFNEISDTARHEFRYKNTRQYELLVQIVFKVIKSSDIRYNPHSRIIICDCTDIQAREICFLFDFYNQLYIKEEETFFNAFVQKHELFADSDDEPEVRADEDARRMFSYMSAMRDESPLLQIDYKRD